MKISARNTLSGTIKSIEMGAVNNEVAIELAPGVVLTSVVTKASCERLGLKVGDLRVRTGFVIATAGFYV